MNNPVTYERRPIPCLPDYFADSNGHIWDGDQKLKEYFAGPGYLMINVKPSVRPRGRRSQYVHRLVLLAFCGEPSPGQECRHLDGVRRNNQPINLKWGVRKDNAWDTVKHGRSRRGHNNKLTADDVQTIRVLYHSEGYWQDDLANIFGVTKSAIGTIIRRERWAWLDDHVTQNICARVKQVMEEHPSRYVQIGKLLHLSTLHRLRRLFDARQAAGEPIGYRQSVHGNRLFDRNAITALYDAREGGAR